MTNVILQNIIITEMLTIEIALDFIKYFPSNEFKPLIKFISRIKNQRWISLNTLNLIDSNYLSN